MKRKKPKPTPEPKVTQWHQIRKPRPTKLPSRGQRG